MTTVQKIHKEIDTAQDRLLIEAEDTISKLSLSEENLSKFNLLKKAGFINSEEYISLKASTDISNKSIKNAELINYYKNKYPFIKFLTIEEFDKICDKYNLIYAPSSCYIKHIPVDNLKEIDLSQSLSYMDEPNKIVLYKVEISMSDLSSGMRVNGLTLKERNLVRSGIIIEKDKFRNNECSKMLTEYFNKPVKAEYDGLYQDVINIDRSGLFIAAPKSHFNLKTLKKLNKGFFNFKPEPKDPIVFRYVKGGLQVLSKWGAEENEIQLHTFGIN